MNIRPAPLALVPLLLAACSFEDERASAVLRSVEADFARMGYTETSAASAEVVDGDIVVAGLVARGGGGIISVERLVFQEAEADAMVVKWYEPPEISVAGYRLYAGPAPKPTTFSAAALNAEGVSFAFPEGSVTAKIADIAIEGFDNRAEPQIPLRSIVLKEIEVSLDGATAIEADLMSLHNGGWRNGMPGVSGFDVEGAVFPVALGYGDMGIEGPVHFRSGVIGHFRDDGETSGEAWIETDGLGQWSGEVVFEKVDPAIREAVAGNAEIGELPPGVGRAVLRSATLEASGLGFLDAWFERMSPGARDILVDHVIRLVDGVDPHVAEGRTQALNGAIGNLAMFIRSPEAFRMSLSPLASFVLASPRGGGDPLAEAGFAFEDRPHLPASR